MRAARPLVLTLAAVVLAGPFAPVAAQAATGPTVTITSPAAGSSVTGTVTVTVASNVDPGDIADARTTLLVNGIALTTKPCDPAVGLVNCPTTFTWDSTGLNGSYAVGASVTVASAPGTPAVATVQVTVTNPLPQASITSPAAGAVIKGGTLTVNATGSVDPSQSDQPVALQLWVDGAKYGAPQQCDQASKSCSYAFAVTQPTWSGSHSVQVTMATKLTSASSAVVPYLFYSPTKTSLQAVAPLRAGKRTGIRGSVIGLNAGSPVAGARVVVTIAPAVGKKKVVVLHTGSTGHFSLAATISANSTVTASVTGARDLGTSHASTKVKALAPIVCKADLTVRHGRNGVGTCTVARLPDGTAVSLQYQAKKKWHVLGSGKTKGTSIVISYKFGAAGRYPVRLVLGANKVYAATYGTPFVVRVT